MITPLGAKRGILSPLGRSVRRAAAGGWWLAGGIAEANCVAAYQPIGAADYATSKVNLANPGTYNAGDGAAHPTWDASDGWTFNSSTYLKPGITPTSAQVYAIRISSWTDTWWSGLFGTYNSAGNATYIGAFPVNGILNCYNYGLASNSCGAKPESGTIIINMDEAYVNGVLVGNLRALGTQAATDYYIGGFHRVDYSIYRRGHFKCQAFGQWNEQLTSDQVAALHTAMAAL